MSWTKGDYVTMAMEMIGLAGYNFDHTSDELASALKKLDAMMAGWNAREIRLGYPLPASPNNSNVTDVTECPDTANEAIYTNLAIRLCPMFGKTVSAELRQAAYQSYLLLLRQGARPIEMQYNSSIPAGAGNKNRLSDNPFLDSNEDDPLTDIFLEN